MFQQQFWQHALQILQNLLHYSKIKIINKILNIFLSFINKKAQKNISSTCCQHSRTIWVLMLKLHVALKKSFSNMFLNCTKLYEKKNIKKLIYILSIFLYNINNHIKLFINMLLITCSNYFNIFQQ